MSYVGTVPELTGRRVTVMGLGLFGGGLAAARFLCGRGARVTVTDLKSADALRESVAALEKYPVTLHLGGHDLRDFTDTDLLVVNPGVAPDSPYLAAAEKAGVPFETELNLFWKLCPCPIAAVTGSNGKTTTTALLGEMIAAGTGREIVRHDAPLPDVRAPSPPPPLPLRGRGKSTSRARVWVGGNIGRPLIEAVPLMRPDDWAVLEVSSFQCEALSAAKLHPRIAVVTNLQPNHLDRHGTMEAYERAKFGITEHQDRTEVCVLNLGDPRIALWRDRTAAHVQWFGGGERGPVEPRKEEPLTGVLFTRSSVRDMPRGLNLIHGQGCLSWFLGSLEGRLLIGKFNVDNIAAAASATVGVCDLEAACDARAWAHPRRQDAFDSIARIARTFPGVEHRLEYVATVRGVACYNDSIATNPDSVICALDALTAPAILLAGGSDKQLPFDRLGAKITERAKRCILFGATAEKILAAVTAAGGAAKCTRVPDLEAAVREAAGAAVEGDIVLLSPACASFDQFRNFAERGRKFKELVHGLAGGGPQGTDGPGGSRPHGRTGSQ